MQQAFAEIVALIHRQSPLHAKRIKAFLETTDAEFAARASEFLGVFVSHLSRQGRDLQFGVSCYVRMIEDMRRETLRFMKTGRYSCQSFVEAYERVYSQPEVMEYYMTGLLLSQFLWKHHYEILQFFSGNLREIAGSPEHYLEVGGGHGLFTAEAIECLSPSTAFEVVDISETSLEFTRLLVNSSRVQYHLADIYDFAPPHKYGFICLGEVLEHVERPLDLLHRLVSMLSPGGRLFVTVPANSPAIDHIFLFQDVDHIRSMLHDSGLRPIREYGNYVEDVSPEEARRLRITFMYAAFLERA